MDTDHVRLVLAEVLTERHRQHRQHHRDDAPTGQALPLGTGDDAHALLEHVSAALDKTILSGRPGDDLDSWLRSVRYHVMTRYGLVTMADRLTAEWACVMEAEDPQRVRTALLCLAAVAVAGVEGIDQREAEAGVR